MSLTLMDILITYVVALLSQLKIACLDGLRREVKQKYNEHLQAYVTEYFGRPLEKLNVSFLFWCELDWPKDT